MATLPDDDARELLVANVDDGAELFIRDGDDVDSFVVGGEDDDGDDMPRLFGLRPTIQ